MFIKTRNLTFLSALDFAVKRVADKVQKLRAKLQQLEEWVVDEDIIVQKK